MRFLYGAISVSFLQSVPFELSFITISLSYQDHGGCLFRTPDFYFVHMQVSGRGLFGTRPLLFLGEFQAQDDYRRRNVLRSSSRLYNTSSVANTMAWMQNSLTINPIDYVVEARRFDIFETTGCQSAVYVSIPSLLIICIPQLLFFMIAMTYASMLSYL